MSSPSKFRLATANGKSLFSADMHKPSEDESIESSHNGEMDTVGRYELDARLEAIEARMDARMVHIESMVASIAKSQDEITASHKSTRNTIIGTGVAVVLGIAAFNATVLSNMVASFESGKNTAATQAASERAITEATKALEAATEKAKQVSTQTKPGK